ncbi:MAG TPA: DUF4445 domain-containing protein [Clostridiaceae bacterium]|nr:DUF4445 domain-containing protein [Clostridiaceae bacterium]
MESMENCKVVVCLVNEKTELSCAKGSILKNVLSQNGFFIDTPCGGKGLCGKCKVKVLQAQNTLPTEEESLLLGKMELEQGFRLACTYMIQQDIEVEMPGIVETAQILTSGWECETSRDVGIIKQYLVSGSPSISDQRDDVKRIQDLSGVPDLHFPLHVMKSLPDILEKSNYKTTIVRCNNHVLKVEAGNTEKASYGVAIDIGTTTIAVYLMDLATGEQVGVLSELNRQKAYGADVISRINHTMENPEGSEQLRSCIITQLDNMIKNIAANNHASLDNIYHMVIAGNTTMLHLLMGLPVKNIALSPFIPVITEKIEFTAEELGFNLGKSCMVTLLPCISAYVGADIVAGILSSRMVQKNAVSMLIDIGTNGEIALFCKNRIYCCSTAAGPAFEGAHIRNGIGGVKGAINKAEYKDGRLAINTILNHAPIGICGSGVLDIAAIMLENGIIDETGRFAAGDEAGLSARENLRKRLTQIDGQPAFVVWSDTAANDILNPAGVKSIIAITQKDIRELQLAKAAISAGVKVLINSAGISMKDVDNVFLAGGFGSYINKDSAIKIGLIPAEFKDKITVLGNAAGTGAKMCLLSVSELVQTGKIKDISRYIELSALPEFHDEFVDSMFFGD